MQRMTLILLLVAGLAGIGVYYYEAKWGKSSEEVDIPKAALDIQREDITAINLTRGNETTSLELQDNKWMIKQPITSPADENVLNQLIGELVNARVDREFPASAEELKSYGLAEPAVKLEIKLKNGQTKRLELGVNDPLGSLSYGRVNGSANVAMLPAGLLANANKSVNDLRDRTLLGSSQYELNTVKVTNESGSYELAKNDSQWTFKSPIDSLAEETEVNNLIVELTQAKAVEIVSETGEDPAKYGIDKAKVKFTVQTTTGNERTVSVGSKVDDKYYAKVSDRPQIVKIDASVYEKLNTKVSALRSKSFVKFSRDNITGVQIKNSNVTLFATKTDTGKWVVKEPADKKDKEVYPFKLFDPLELKATEVIDKPSGAITAKLAKPAAEVRLTDNTNKTTVIKVSAADGDNVYVTVEGRSTVYKVAKSMIDSLSFKIDDAIQQ